MSMGNNPYTPSSGGMSGGMVPEDLAKKANNLQLMGILSIVFAFCCGIVTLVLSIMVLMQAGGVTAALQQYGSPPELMSKVSTGKTCAIIGLVILGLAFCGGVLVQVLGIMAQR